MTTLSDMVEDVREKLEGFTQDQNIYAVLTNVGGIDDNDVTFTTFPAVTPGIVELGDELVYVGAVNPSTGVATGCIRGFRRTQAWAHDQNSVVIDSPRVTRKQIKQAINDTILSLGERVGAVRTVIVTTDGGQLTYDVPSDCLEVLSVAVQVPGASDSWPKSRRWRFNRTAGGDSVSGRTIDLLEFVLGYDVLVTYLASATALVSEWTSTPTELYIDDEFTDSGLPAWLYETVILGACARIVTFMDAAGVTARSGDQHLLNGQAPWGSSLQLAKYLTALYESKVEQAALRQRQEYDTVTYFQG